MDPYDSSQIEVVAPPNETMLNYIHVDIMQ